MNRLPRRLAAAFLVGAFSLSAHASEITVSAAASLTNAFKELAPLFEAAAPGTTVRLNFAASGVLLQQLAKGAPVDILATADQETMDQAQAQALISVAERRNFASNALVVIVPSASTDVPSALSDLSKPAYARVAIGMPASVPVGRYTKSALEAAGLWPAVEHKTVRANNVRQALDYVARAEADAGFVYASDAALMPHKVKVAFVVPTPMPILYPIAPAAASPNSALARHFVEFVVSPRAQALLAKHGFGAP